MFSIRRWFLPRRLLILFFVLVLLIAIYFTISSFSIKEIDNSENCRIDIQTQTNLLNLASSTDVLLTAQNITHFLCYGTLWGALRFSNLLPWKKDFDFCLINDDLISRIDEGYLRRLFRVRGLEIEYGNARGVYTIWNAKRGRIEGVLNLYIFEKLVDDKIMRRVGLNRLIPGGVDAPDSFPMHLVALPLSKAKISDLAFPVPREGVEIQKYHYKDNWWTEAKPDGC